MSSYLFDGVECEDYDQHWGFTDFKDKVVLDCGADSGSTASYFLSRGAKHVIAVSGRAEYDGLVAHVKKFGWEDKVTPVNCWISSVADFIALITEFKPDILKCDLDPETREIKLPEWYLFECPDEILSKVPEYMIEWHDNESQECVNPNHMLFVWPERFEKLGYSVETKFHSGIVIWARKR
jgi:hypothetical protein